MAEFCEVMRQFDRLCASNDCIKCPMEGMCGLVKAKLFPDEFEKRVMEWAKVYTGPVYPTWVEWMRYTKLLVPDHYSFFAGETLGKKAYEPIPADIAKGLGIKPKEAT